MRGNSTELEGSIVFFYPFRISFPNAYCFVRIWEVDVLPYVFHRRIIQGKMANIIRSRYFFLSFSHFLCYFFFVKLYAYFIWFILASPFPGWFQKRIAFFLSFCFQVKYYRKMDVWDYHLDWCKEQVMELMTKC